MLLYIHIYKIIYIKIPSASEDSSVLAPSILAAIFTILRIASKRENN